MTIYVCIHTYVYSFGQLACLIMHTYTRAPTCICACVRAHRLTPAAPTHRAPVSAGSVNSSGRASVPPRADTRYSEPIR
jgi:hypothetical protein